MASIPTKCRTVTGEVTRKNFYDFLRNKISLKIVHKRHVIHLSFSPSMHSSLTKSTQFSIPLRPRSAARMVVCSAQARSIRAGFVF